MEPLKPQFVTVDDFNNYHNLNLREILLTYGDDSYAAEKFLAVTEIKLMNWIDTVTFRRKNWNELNPKQKLLFQYAILEQANYRLNNGDIGLDSGYNPKQGKVADPGYLSQIRVSNDAIMFLSNAGLYNKVIKNRPRTFSGVTADLNKF